MKKESKKKKNPVGRPEENLEALYGTSFVESFRKRFKFKREEMYKIMGISRYNYYSKAKMQFLPHKYHKSLIEAVGKEAFIKFLHGWCKKNN